MKPRTAKKGLQGTCPACGQNVYRDEFPWFVALHGAGWHYVHRGQCQKLFEAAGRVALGWLRAQKGRPPGRRLKQKERLDL